MRLSTRYQWSILLGRYLRKVNFVLRKAAPRFELGIKDLQSSALPLGHAALNNPQLYLANRISHYDNGLLVICNGHGEDLIALRVIESLHKIFPDLLIEVLPMVGEGHTFQSAISEGWLKRVGPLMRLPSGGFSNQSLKGLFADLAAGLLQNTIYQLLAIRKMASKGKAILAVGDFLPLSFAWISGADFGFIGTPKSDYTWNSGPTYSFNDCYHRIKGTEWDPWEYALMKSSKCKFVAVRDGLTARGLRRHGVNAHAPGNPMMDGFSSKPSVDVLHGYRRLILLCGSRSPEAQTNFKRLIYSLEFIKEKEPLAFLAPIGSQPDLNIIESILSDSGYQACQQFKDQLGACSSWTKHNKRIFLGRGQFYKWAELAEVGLANAGTATEQITGLGIPMLSLPGKGPQFTKSFAVRQSRLLGGAVLACSSPKSLAEHLERLLQDKTLRSRIGSIGSRRMGSPGGSSALAKIVAKFLLVD